MTGQQLTLSGSGFGNNGSLPQGALNSQTNTNNTWAGNVVLAANSTIGSQANATLTISGIVSGTASLTAVGPGAIALSGADTYTANTTVNGSTLTLSNTNAYTGTTSINGASFGGAFVGGTLDFTGLGALTAATPGAISINQNSTLQLDNNTSNNVVNRLHGAAITFNAGTLQLVANNNPGVVTSETVGAVTLASGQSTINAGYTSSQATGATSTLTAASLVRNAGATVNFIGGTANITPLGTNGNELLFNNLSAAPAATTALQFLGNQGNILPYAEVNGVANSGDFATYTSSGIAPFSAYATLAATTSQTLTFVAGDIVNVSALAGGITLTGPANAIGALIINNTSGGTVVFSPSFSSAATITSGAFLTTGGSLTAIGGGSTPTFNVGTETVLFQNTATSFNNAGTIGYLAGSGGLTIAGSSTLTMGTNVNAVQTITFTANTTIAGTFTLTFNGQTTAPITYSATTATLEGNIQQALFALPNVGPLGPNSITVSNAANPVITFQNAFGGTFIPLLGVNAAGLTGTGTIAITNTTIGGQANTYTGTTALNAGTVVTQHSASFGSGALTLTGGTLNTNAAMSLGNAVTFNGPVTFANTGTLTLLGPVSLGANNALTVNSNPLLITGAISGPTGVPLTLTGGNNTLELFGAGTYAGGVLQNGATLNIANPAALGSGALTLTGGSLQTFSDMTISTPVFLPNTTGTLSGINNITFTNLDVLGTSVLSDQDSGLVTIAGTLGIIPGGGGGVLSTAGSIVTRAFVHNPTTNNAAGTLVPSGLLELGSATALGSGPQMMTGGSLTATGTLTVPNNVYIDLGGLTTVGAPALTFAGSTTLLSSQTITVNNAGTTFSGTITESNGSQSLTATGIGAVAFTATNYFTGGFNLNSQAALGVAASFYNLTFTPGSGSLVAGTVPFASPVFSRTDSIINYPGIGAGFGSPGNPGQAAALPANVQVDNVAAQFIGFLNIVQGGAYTFSTTSDDNSVLYIDGILVVNNDFNQGATTRSNAVGANNGAGGLTAPLNLAPGFHTFKVQYIQGGGGASLLAQYSGPDTGGSLVTLSAAASFTSPGLLAGSSVNTILAMSNPGGLGTGAVNFNSGIVQALNPVTFINPVSFGPIGSGSVALAGSPITFSNAVNLVSNTPLSVNNTTTISGALSGTNTLILSNTPVVVIPNALTPASNLTGGGTLVLNNATDTDAGTTVSAGTLTVNGAGILTTPTVTLTTGGTQTQDNSVTNDSNRLGGATVTLGGGQFNYLGAPGAASTETLGGIGVSSGNSTIKTTAGTGTGSSVVLTATTFTGRTAGATVNLTTGNNQILGSAANQVVISIPASTLLTGGIIPGVTVNDGTTSVTVGTTATPSSGFNLATATGAASASIAPLTTYQALLAGGTNAPTDNVFVTASATLTANDTINSLFLSGSGITVGGNFTLNLGSGAAMLASTGGVATGNTVSVATVALGNNEGIVTTNTGGLTLSSTVTGAGTAGLTLGGPGQLTLSGTNTYTGTTTLNVGTLVIGNNAALSTGPVVLSGGTLQTTVANGLILHNPVTLNNAQLTLAGSDNLIFAGSLTINGFNTINVTNTAITDFDGTYLASNGTLFKSGTGTLILSGGSNTFTGQAFVSQGILELENSNALGVGGNQSVVASGASLELLGTGLTINKPIILSGSGVSGGGALENLIGGNNIWQGAITVAGATTIGVDAGTSLTQATNSLLGWAPLTKVGPGTLVVTANNSAYAGQINDNNGVLNVQTSGSLGLDTSATVVNTGSVGTVQTINISGSPTGGTFTLSFNGTNTTPIAFSATLSTLLANILAALVAVPGIGSAANVAVGGSTSRRHRDLPWGPGRLFAARPGRRHQRPHRRHFAGRQNHQLRRHLAGPGRHHRRRQTVDAQRPGLRQRGLSSPGRAVQQRRQHLDGRHHPEWHYGHRRHQRRHLHGERHRQRQRRLDQERQRHLRPVVARPPTPTPATPRSTAAPSRWPIPTPTPATTVNMAASNSTVNGGALLLNLLGAAPNTSSITVNGSGMYTQTNESFLQLDNSQLVSSTRLSTTTPIFLNGATLNFVAANAAATTTQALGAVTLASGQNTIAAGYDITTPAQVAPGATSQLTFTSLTRNPGATVDFFGGSTGVITTASGFAFATANISPLGTANSPLGTVNNQILITTINGVAAASAVVGSSTVAAYLGDGILPWAEVNGASGTGGFATYGGHAGVGINAFQGYVTSIAAASPTDTVLETNPETVLFSKTINALEIFDYAALLVAINANVTLTVTSGGFMAAGSIGQIQLTNFNNGVPVGTLNFGPTEGFVFNNSSSGNTNIDTFLTGTAGVTVGGQNSTTWNVGNSTFTGGLFINAGSLVASAPNPATSTSNGIFGLGAVTFSGGTWTGNFAAVISNPVNLNGMYNFNTNPVVFLGPITLTSNAILSASNTLYLNGVIGESGGTHSLTIANSAQTGGSAIFINNANTFSGGLVLASSTTPLELGNAAAAGTGGLILDSGVLDADVAVTLSSPVLLPNLSAQGISLTIAAGQIGTNGTITAGNNLTFGGPVTLIGNNTLTITNGGTTSFTGGINGSGDLVLSGSGTVLLPTANALTGGLTFGGGPVILNNANAVGTAPLILAGGSLTSNAPSRSPAPSSSPASPRSGPTRLPSAARRRCWATPSSP